MPEFELLLEVDPLTDAQEDAILDGFDAFVGGHGDTTLVTITSDGPTAESALRATTHALATHGITVRRLVEDLVTRKAIASRAGVTTQSVGLWVRGERRTDDAFPPPYTLAGGGLWLWGEVNEWLARNAHRYDDIAYPSRADYARGNAWLLDRATEARYVVVITPVKASVPRSAQWTAPLPDGEFRPFQYGLTA